MARGGPDIGYNLPPPRKLYDVARQDLLEMDVIEWSEHNKLVVDHSLWMLRQAQLKSARVGCMIVGGASVILWFCALAFK